MMTRNKIVFTCLAVLALVGVVMLLRIHPRVVFSLDGLDLTGTDAITVGRGSVVSFDQLPRDYLTITRSGNQLVWTINDQWVRQDSVYYMKVNDENPNRHSINPAQSIVVNTGRHTYTLPASEVDELLSGHDSQYVLLHHALDKYLRQHGHNGLPEEDAKAIRSFFFRTKKTFPIKRVGPWQLVIIDTKTRLTGEGADITYVTSGTVGNRCKVQFYRMSDNSLKSDDSDLFRIGDISHITKPVLITTEWGAGHATISRAEGTMTIRYPKPLTYTEDKNTLLSITHDRTSTITIKQDDGGLPTGDDIYIPHFSSSVPTELCHLHINGNTLSLGSHDLTARHTLLPILPEKRIIIGNAALYLHAGTVGRAFVLSYLWLPLLIFLIIFLTYPRLVAVPPQARLPKSAYDLPHVFRMVAAIAAVYCICRAAIAIKLTWTYPYFEKITTISVCSAALMLTLLFTLSLLLNHNFLTARSIARRGATKRLEPWVAVAISTAAVMLCALALQYTERHANSMVLSSYLPDQRLTLWPFDWRILWPPLWSDIDAVVDLHRSVPFTLLWFNIIAILVLIAFNIFGKPQLTLHSWLLNSKVPFTKEVVVNNVRYYTKFLSRADLTAVFIAAFYAVLAALATTLPGNYSTAAITLCVMLGAGFALNHMDYQSNRYVAGAITLTIAGLLFMGAIGFLLVSKADKGYITNLPGLIIFMAVIFMAAWKKTKKHGNENRERQNEIRIIKRVVTALFVVVFIAAPLFFQWKYDPEEVRYDRSPRRFMTTSQFEDYLSSGYRYAVSDGEFMMVMTHSMFNTSGADPLSPERHYLHPSVSTGQSPVVLNDLCVPIAFFGTYGIAAYLLYFGLVVLLLYAVVSTAMPESDPRNRGNAVLDATMVWKLLAVMMWASTTYYLYASYVGILPFTGRLNPGFGADSVGEALESTFLMAFMTATAYKLRPTVQH